MERSKHRGSRGDDNGEGLWQSRFIAHYRTFGSALHNQWVGVSNGANLRCQYYFGQHYLGHHYLGQHFLHEQCAVFRNGAKRRCQHYIANTAWANATWANTTCTSSVRVSETALNCVANTTLSQHYIANTT